MQISLFWLISHILLLYLELFWTIPFSCPTIHETLLRFKQNIKSYLQNQLPLFTCQFQMAGASFSRSTRLTPSEVLCSFRLLSTHRQADPGPSKVKLQARSVRQCARTVLILRPVTRVLFTAGEQSTAGLWGDHAGFPRRQRPKELEDGR